MQLLGQLRSAVVTKPFILPLLWHAPWFAADVLLCICNSTSPIIRARAHSSPLTMNRRRHAVTILQASQDSPTFARLTELTRDSVARLQAIEFLIPSSLRSMVTAGPIEGQSWCLILSNNAAAAKIRQLTPSFQAHLRTKGWDVTTIRLKVQINKMN